jgi:hypothetical protein
VLPAACASWRRMVIEWRSPVIEFLSVSMMLSSGSLAMIS